MTAQPGQMLSHYRLLEKIGEGGMGVVWKAFDTKLNRHTALKVLPAELTADPERRRRMQREARAAAAVTHPNIATIYEVGEFEGITFISMELVAGRTLRAVIGGGPMSIPGALRLGAEIAEGLVRAHQAGIVHRDLKPDNILIGADGRPKILDFGLARILEPQREVPGAPPSEQETRTEDMTREGTILGTPSYMSPEQVRGEAVDARSDVFAFGVVLYEMVTGRVPFRGGNRIGTLSAILNEPAVAASRLNTQVPAQLDLVLGKCLDKDAGSRYQSTQDLAVDLRRMARTSESGPSLSYAGSRDASTAAIATWPPSRRRIKWAVAAVLLLSAGVWGVAQLRQTPVEARLTRFMVLPPKGNRFLWQLFFMNVSPDGSRIAFLAVDSSGDRQLWVQSLDSLSAQLLPGTEWARTPFWSPDGRFIAFGADGKLKKIDAAGGPIQTLCDASTSGGGAWNQRGVIVFTPDWNSPIYRVPADGGVPTAVTSLDPTRQETGHSFPSFLPDGNHFLYVVKSRIEENNGIWVGSLESKVSKRILATLTSAQYAPPGYLLFERDGTLLAQRFDATSLELTGAALPIASGVQSALLYGFGKAAFSASDTGVLAFRTGAGFLTQLTWLDRSGKSQEPVGPPGAYLDPELSPDGNHVAVALMDENGGRDLWLTDLRRGTSTRFSFEADREMFPVWGPDGSWLAFNSGSGWEGGWGDFTYPRRRIGGTEEKALPLEPGRNRILLDLSSDGRSILYYDGNGQAGPGLWSLPLLGEGKPQPFVRISNLTQARFSPDSRWVAYVDDESGRPEVYVDNFPTPNDKRQISINGGKQPRWRRDGRELFFIAADGRLMAVPIRGGTVLEIGTPVALFDAHIGINMGDPGGGRHQYDVSADGQRFLINMTSSEPSPLTVVLNWTVGLKP